MSPTQRSLAKLRKEGWLCGLLEKWIPVSPAGYKGKIIRVDLWNFADLIAVRDNRVLLIQTTSGSNVPARVKKIATNTSARVWLLSPHRQILVHGWAERGPKDRVKKWTCREVALSYEKGKMFATDVTGGYTDLPLFEEPAEAGVV